MTTYGIIHVNWDSDGTDPQELGLPLHPGNIEADSADDLADILSDQYGYCVNEVFYMTLPATSTTVHEDGTKTQEVYA